MISLSKDNQFSLLRVFKFQMVTNFSLNYLYIYYFCFVIIYQSNQVSLNALDNLCIKVLAGWSYTFVFIPSLID